MSKRLLGIVGLLLISLLRGGAQTPVQGEEWDQNVDLQDLQIRLVSP